MQTEGPRCPEEAAVRAQVGVGREQGVKEIFGVYFEAGTSRVGLWIGGGL